MTADVSALTVAEAEEVLLKEADLLDEYRLEEWLTLFTDDAGYWLPARRSASDPQRDNSLIFDDRERMNERVWRLTAGPAHAQIPQSATQRLITNVRVGAPGARGECLVRSNFVIYEVRKGEQRSFAGRYEHTLRHDGESWLIAYKKAILVNCESPLFNLTFMV